MHKACTDPRFILVITVEISNYLVEIPLYRWTWHVIGEALVIQVCCKYGPGVIYFSMKAKHFYWWNFVIMSNGCHKFFTATFFTNFYIVLIIYYTNFLSIYTLDSIRQI